MHNAQVPPSLCWNFMLPMSAWLQISHVRHQRLCLSFYKQTIYHVNPSVIFLMTKAIQFGFSAGMLSAQVALICEKLLLWQTPFQPVHIKSNRFQLLHMLSRKTLLSKCNTWRWDFKGKTGKTSVQCSILPCLRAAPLPLPSLPWRWCRFWLEWCIFQIFDFKRQNTAERIFNYFLWQILCSCRPGYYQTWNRIHWIQALS